MSVASPVAGGPLRKAAWLLGALVALAYGSSIDGAFHFDDSHCIESNVAIHSLSNIPQIWTDPRTSSFIPENRNYRPLSFTFFTLAWAAGGGEPWAFHVMKMLMHFGVCLGIFLVWGRLFAQPGWLPKSRELAVRLPALESPWQVTPQSAALLLAAVFAVHPALSETVIYISPTTSLLCALCYLWSYWFYLRSRETKGGRELLISLALYFLAVASKEEGITLPAMVFLTELMLAGGGFRARLRSALSRVAPYAVFGLLLAVWVVMMRPSEGDESRGAVSSLTYFITQWRVYLMYLKLWFWPFELNADNVSIQLSRSLLDPLVIQAALGNALVIGLAWWQRARWPALLFGLAWFYVAVSPTSSFVVLAEAMNEHRMYLAFAGLGGGVVAVLAWVAEAGMALRTRPAWLGAWVMAIFAAMLIGTYQRNQVWRTSEALWLDTVAKNPTSGRALNNLALVYMSRGEHARAISYFEQCEQHWSAYMYCPLNKAISLSSLGRLDDAEKAFQRALQLSPRSTHVTFHMARFYQESRHDCAKAVPLFELSIQVTGGRNPAADVWRASCLQSMGRLAEAREGLERAVALDPVGEHGWLYLSQVADLQKDGKRAVVAARRLASIQKKPEYVNRLQELERRYGAQ